MASKLSQLNCLFRYIMYMKHLHLYSGALLSDFKYNIMVTNFQKHITLIVIY